MRKKCTLQLLCLIFLFPVSSIKLLAQINMGNTISTNVCSGNFYDNGGPGSNYSNSQYLVHTIVPTSGNFLQVVFNSFQLETCCDWLRIYDGNSVNAPLIGQYATNPGTITSTAPDGSLTFVFSSDGSVTYSGWDASLNCLPQPPCSAPPTAGSAITSVAMPCLGTPFVVFLSGSTFGSGQTYQWESSPDNNTWTVIPGATNSTYNNNASAALYYRCIVTCSGQSDISASVLVNTQPCINMTNGSISNICSGNFYDNGGSGGNYSNSQYLTYTIYPSSGNYLQANFQSFQLETCCDWLRIYDGNSINAPLIGQYATNPGTITSTANDGSLTFVFSSDGSVTYSGWDAALSCVPQPACIAPPTAGTATASSSTPCTGTPFNITLAGGTSGNGQSYQWESSPDNIAWTPIPGETNPAYNATALSTEYYRCIVTCSGQNDTSSAVLVSAVACINMSNGSSTNVCAGNFYDSGGPGANYQNNENSTYTITPPPGNFLQVVFNSFQLETCCDWLRIYDGNSINAPLIGQFATNPGTITSTASDGSLTFVFFSDGSVLYSGWEATLACVPQPANDAGIVQILSPSFSSMVGCQINDTLIVELTTIGTNNLTSAVINASVNNGPPVSFNWTGNISQYQTVTVNAGILNLNDGDQLRVWTSNPNGTIDDDHSNDTVNVTVYNAMSGVYTIGGNNPDFATIADARAALLQRGICADIIFNIRSGLYTEQVSLPPLVYVNNSFGSTVTFQAESLVADSVRISFSPSSTANNYIVRFDGADHVIFNAVSLVNTSTTYARVIEFRASSDSNEIRNSILMGDTLTASDNFDKIVIVSTADNDDYNKIINNRIWGGSRAISLGGTSALDPEIGAVIEGNDIRNFYLVGSAVFNQLSPVINDNTYRTNTVNTNVFRIYANTVYDGIQINGNRMYGSQGGFGINLDNVNGTTLLPGVVTNNFVYMGDSVGSANSEGIYLQNQTSVIDLLHNSVYVRNANAASAGIQLGAGTGGVNAVRVLNNNVVNDGAGKALKVISGYNVMVSDYNNFYAVNTPVEYTGTQYATVAAYSAATSWDAHSWDVDPNFSGDDLHTCRVELDNAGTPVGVAIDFDGDVRNMLTPDIGADEFIGAAPISLGPDTIVCSGVPVDFGVEYIQGADYVWQPFMDTTATITATFAGQYILTVTSACGTQTDTVNLIHVPIPIATFSTTTNFFTVITNNGSTNGTSYHWDFGDGNTSTEFSPSHVYTNNGSFIITLTVYNECGDSAQYIRQVNITAQHVGLDEIENVSMSLFPNPTDGAATIRLTYPGHDQVNIRIEDIAGRVVQVSQVQGTGGELQIPVDMSRVAPGTYFVKVQAGQFESVKKLIVK